jgi:membrane protein YqaA with SNARE-associated domain
VLQTATLRRHSLSIFSHLGALGLFFLAILDSSPFPTFGGPDVLIVILVATRSHPWYEFASVAAAGSVIGAYLTFRLARQAGQPYLEKKFGKAKVGAFMELFKQWGTSALIASAAIPFPFPTSLVFAAAGASEYSMGKFVAVVLVARGLRYAAVAFLADRYGRSLTRVFLHPVQHWGWFLAFSAIVALVLGAGFFLNRRLLGTSQTAPAR